MIPSFINNKLVNQLEIVEKLEHIPYAHCMTLLYNMYGIIIYNAYSSP